MTTLERFRELQREREAQHVCAVCGKDLSAGPMLSDVHLSHMPNLGQLYGRRRNR